MQCCIFQIEVTKLLIYLALLLEVCENEGSIFPVKFKSFTNLSSHSPRGEFFSQNNAHKSHIARKDHLM